MTASQKETRAIGCTKICERQFKLIRFSKKGYEKARMRARTSSVVSESTLQPITRELMRVRRGENDITSKSCVGDLRNNILVGLSSKAVKVH